MDSNEFHIRASHINPDDDQPVHCNKCGWDGEIIDCDWKATSTSDHLLALRKGYVWFCPKCRNEVWRYYYMMS